MMHASGGRRWRSRSRSSSSPPRLRVVVHAARASYTRVLELEARPPDG